MTSQPEASQEASKKPKRVKGIEATIKAMESLVATVEPVQNNGWLLGMRPSQALLCCIGSGPWKINRRTTIQQGALALLGASDLIDKRNELSEFFPLDWQKRLVLDIGRYFHLSARCQFDATQSKRPTDTIVALEAALGSTMYNFPKVMCMFVRDYLELPIIPRDRHVNEKLKAFGLPLNTQEATEALAHVVGPDRVNDYARGIFSAKSENPKHTL